MTIKARIINEGNCPDDTLMFRGFKQIGTEDGHQWIQWTGDPNDQITLLQGEEVVFAPNNTGHFDEFQSVDFKAKH